ncbi:MAG: precorrin-3B synthase [Brasilonema octagenarum HA4186-MV1]|nr:precorrin-3B synthase [Brasilonema octagenarum HA4186-MV1]
MLTPRVSCTHSCYLLSASHGEGVVGVSGCPGLFYQTSARDGILSRIRVPGGILTSQQFRVIADLADEWGTGYTNITNRANLQIRAIRTEIPAKFLRVLQDIGIASAVPEVDHLRNIMGSPTSGIDLYELIDTRPLISKLDHYITTHPELAPLSPKFSVAFDGGGSVSIGERSNDIALTAVMVDNNVYFRFKLNLGTSLFEPFIDTDILLKPEECVEVVGALAQVYLQHLTLEIGNTIPHRKSRQPRFWEILNNLGIERFLQKVERHLPYPLRRFSVKSSHTQIKEEYRDIGCNVYSKYQHIGVHPQRHKGLSYIGVVVPVGRLNTLQIRGLADIAETYANATLRLTPWQNLLISDIPQQWIPKIQSKIENLGLHWSATNIRSALVACAGNTGCASSATDTKNHALALAQYLDDRVILDQPINIHFTGCEKSCAQHSRSDIALVGFNIEDKGEVVEGYKVCVGDGDSHEKFGRELYGWVSFTELPSLLERMLQIYMAERDASNTSFGEFVNQYVIADLQRLFDK